jgi:hypothetical protein
MLDLGDDGHQWINQDIYYMMLSTDWQKSYP